MRCRYFQPSENLVPADGFKGGIQVKLLLLLPAVLLLLGCSSRTKMPNLYNPGTLVEQRAEYAIYDPYPQVDVGPEIEGGRPTSYQVPYSESKQRSKYPASPYGYRPATTAPAWSLNPTNQTPPVWDSNQQNQAPASYGASQKWQNQLPSPVARY